jgi:hypothetical protein
MKDIIEYITEKKVSDVILTLSMAEDILAFIDKNNLTDKAKKDFSGWYDTLKDQVDKFND